MALPRPLEFQYVAGLSACVNYHLPVSPLFPNLSCSFITLCSFPGTSSLNGV